MDDLMAEAETLELEAGDDGVAQAQQVAKQFADVRAAIGRVVLGQHEVIDQTLITLLAGGHGLLVGVPGLAKTRLVETLGIVLGLDWKRIQFTPDLMPADIVGSEVLEDGDSGRRSFRFLHGPVFTQLLMADEINRASPRTQSALLQAMQERYVTIAGQRYDLPAPFHVLATQNPLEHEGTYPLPEAQLDRFLLQIDVTYPDEDAERRMLIATTFGDEAPPRADLHTRRSDGRAAAGAALAGRREGRRCRIAAGACGTSRSRRRNRISRLDFLGPGTARQSGLHAGDPRQGVDRGPFRAVGR